MKILLCEDDANIVIIAKMALEHVGQHTVTHAADGKVALELASTNQFDLILLDDMMPHISGPDVCKQLFAANRTQAKIIFMSANNQENRIKEYPGFVIGYIPKPFDPMTLPATIDKIQRDSHERAA
jgi:DNA-binding response OmpR family regulator